MEKMISTVAVAEHFDRDVEWVQEQARTGTIPAVKVGAVWRFYPSAIEQYEQRHSNVGADPLTPSPLSRQRQATKRRRSA